jgi:hypothetical protein
MVPELMKRSNAAFVVIALIGVCAVTAQTSSDPLERGFANPPDTAKPRVWWHWMNGNITKEGIKADLEWMKRVGIGGFQNFDAALATPQIVEKRLIYMTPEWKDAFRYTATLADELGLEMAIAGSPGWSESGGPWVPPAEAMKKLVWSETIVEGGRPFTGELPLPPTATGPFQNIPRAGATNTFYADSGVVAYRLPDSEKSMQELQAKVTSSEGGPFDLKTLSDGDLVKAIPLKIAPVGDKAWVQFEFPQPQTIRAITLVLQGVPRRPVSTQDLECSDDGKQFRTVVAIPGGRSPELTISFPAATAKFFRLTFKTQPPIPTEPPPPASHQIAELILQPNIRVNHFEEKAAFATMPDLSTVPTPNEGDTIRKADVIDLTAKLQNGAKLDWTPPPGRWMVLRFGRTLTGAHNSPASPEATGLEVDKLNRTFVKHYLDNYLGRYQDVLGPLMGKRGLQYVITDSWEAGVQNWTDDMITEFTRRRGYDPHPWMPVLTGHVVEGPEASDRFLWDFRKTIAELTAENHYDQIGEALHERGMGRYSESHETGRAFIADGMEVKRNADVPMSAMWTAQPGVYRENFGYNADVRESASVAHIYGQNLVAAESLTAGAYQWAWSPETLKPVADKELAMGLNRFVIHTSVHQPANDKIPGLGLGKYGQWFTRHETWGEVAQPWVTYLSRSSYLLQQGKFVADILYYYGEDSNITALFGSKSPDIPAGYNFDYINADALVNKLSITNGRITAASGMSYRVLALDPRASQMSLPVLRKLHDLVQDGAIVVGAKPTTTPSLSDDPAAFRSIVNQLWGPGTGVQQLGKGRVYGGARIAEVLSTLQAWPDFEADTNLLFVHRALPDGDLYWVDNRSDRTETVDATFRVKGKAAELWHADTGVREAAAYKIANGRTTVPLRLGAYEAVFVMFRKAAIQMTLVRKKDVETQAGTIDGKWDVAFQPNRGAPAKITIDKLSSWCDSSDTGVKYFSGTATYRKPVDVPATWFKTGARLWLDLGDVKNIAQVSVNGKPLGIIWKAPFRVDVTGVLKPGANQLEIKVTNLWVNRLIGDQQPNVTTKYTYTTQAFYQQNSPLLPSGLIGPVQVVRVTKE